MLYRKCRINIFFQHIIPILLLCTIYTANVWARDYFVSPNGLDSNSGTKQQPFASIQKATNVLKPGDTCYLREGTYRETLRPNQSGKPEAPITFANWGNEKVVISGTDPIIGWIGQGKKVFGAPMKWSMGDDNQIFADGVMLCEACWPDLGKDHLFHPSRAIASGGSETTLVCEQIPGADDAWKGARLWCAGGAAWICWTSKVTGYDASSHTLTFEGAQKKWYIPRKGNFFALKGVRSALRYPGQWYYDNESKQLLIIPPEGTDSSKLNIEARRRIDAINLSSRSHIVVRGIHFFGAGLRTNRQSSNIILENLTGRYVSHSNVKDAAERSGVLIFGEKIDMLNCDLGYSSSSVLAVSGSDNRIVNCLIQYGGYGGLWRGTVNLSGRRILFSHNTVRHAGRDLINTHGLMESLVQYNDVSEAGWLTKDLGMFYGHNTDFANTVFRYNLVHDNHAEHCAMGIYFDHLSHNAIVHNNVVWNVGMDPIRFNNPSYCNLVYNNTCFNSGKVGTFDHSKRDDLYASRYVNNIFNKSIDLPDHVAVIDNLVNSTPQFKNAAQNDYRLKIPTVKTYGAYAPDGDPWQAGCDMEHPPAPLPVYQQPRIPWMNGIRNACFEFGTLEGWNKTDSAQATLMKGNGWGNSVLGSNKGHATGTSKFELRLGPASDGISQTVKNLHPNNTYTLSAWIRTADENQTITLGVKQKGISDAKVSSKSTEWSRLTLNFKTAPENTQVTIYLIKSDQFGYAYADNLTLPVKPKN